MPGSTGNRYGGVSGETALRVAGEASWSQALIAESAESGVYRRLGRHSGAADRRAGVRRAARVVMARGCAQ